MSRTAATTDQQRGSSTRRGFLVSAGAGAAGAIALGTVGTAPAGATATRAPASATEPLVAYVRDAHAGEVTVLVGDREVTVHDRDLAARIARAAH